MTLPDRRRTELGGSRNGGTLLSKSDKKVFEPFHERRKRIVNSVSKNFLVISSRDAGQLGVHRVT